VSRYQNDKTSLDFTGARDSEWQWRQLGHMQVCTSLQTDNHASTPPTTQFLQAGCPSCRMSSVKALTATFFSKIQIGRRAFAVHNPMACNSLPYNLRTQQDYESYRQGLKNLAFLQILACSAH